MTINIPTPQMPWRPTVVDKLENAMIILAAFGCATASVKFTGLNGKLGFFVSLFWVPLLKARKCCSEGFALAGIYGDGNRYYFDSNS
jgi:hypothetical protein